LSLDFPIGMWFYPQLSAPRAIPRPTRMASALTPAPHGTVTAPMTTPATKRPDQWFAEGLRYFHQPDGVRAVAAFERVVALDPGFHAPDGDTAHFYLGKICEVEGRLEDAVAHYTRALTLTSRDEESLIGRGACQTVLRRHHEAVRDFKGVLGIPEGARRIAVGPIYYAIAENYRQLGDWAQALDWGRKALAEDPRNQRHLELVAEMQHRMAAAPETNL
jgi:tetratricopeptide (TPR) repeat protein